MQHILSVSIFLFKIAMFDMIISYKIPVDFFFFTFFIYDNTLNQIGFNSKIL